MIKINKDRNHIIVSVLGLKVKIKSKYKYEKCNSWGLNTTEKRKEKIIISLTSFPARIGTVHKTIHTLLTQSIKPDAVILWLAPEQFANKEKDLPQKLLDLQKFGLSIKWCHDIKSYKKLIPALKEHSNDIIVTTDDDVYYAKDCLEKLYVEYKKAPYYVYTHRITRMFYQDGMVKRKHDKDYNLKEYKNASALDKLNGGAGVLYPPKCFHKDIIKEDVFMEICKNNDDVWFWLMALLAGYKTKMVKDPYFKLNIIESSQVESICNTNEIGGEHSPFITQVNAVVNAYPELKNIFAKES